MSDVVGWYGFKSRKPVDRGDTTRIPKELRHPLCWKCRDGRTRAHNRLCRKRGGGHGLERAYRAEVVAARLGEPSPGHVHGAALVQFREIGKALAKSDQVIAEIERNVSLVSARGEDLKELAALYEVA